MGRMDLILLIAGLGIAAGLAVPRQDELTREARRTEVLALARGVASVSELAHTRWLAAGEPATLPGARGVVAMHQGYPSRATLPLLFAEAELLPFGYAGGAWQHREVPAGRYCGVFYGPPEQPGAPARITTRLDGC